MEVTARLNVPVELHIPTGYEAGWVPQPVWIILEKRVICCTCRDSNHDFLVARRVAQSLYQLSCPDMVGEYKVKGIEPN